MTQDRNVSTQFSRSQAGWSPASPGSLCSVLGELRQRRRWKLCDEIGRGGFHLVFKESISGIPRAIKVPLDQAPISMSLRELELAKNVSGHPRIIALVDYLWCQERLITIWEWADGGSLRHALAFYHQLGWRGLPDHLLRSWIMQAAEGIDYLNYSVGIMHRDIKPSNLLICCGQLKLADLGLARPTETSNPLSRLCGTIGFSPPELWTHSPPSPTIDSYSLAVTYVMLKTGHHPFGEGLQEVIDRQRQGLFRLDRLTSREQYYIRQLLHPDPDRRLRLKATEWVSLLLDPSPRIIPASAPQLKTTLHESASGSESLTLPPLHKSLRALSFDYRSPLNVVASRLKTAVMRITWLTTCWATHSLKAAVMVAAILGQPHHQPPITARFSLAPSTFFSHKQNQASTSQAVNNPDECVLPSCYEIRAVPGDDLEQVLLAAPPQAVLRLSSGTYYLHTPLRISQPLAIRGSPNTCLLSTAESAMLIYTGRGRLSIYGITLVHRGAQPAHGIWARSGELRLENIQIIKEARATVLPATPAAIRIDHPATAWIEGCLCHHYAHGILSLTAAPIILLNNVCEANDASGIVVMKTQRLCLRNNRSLGNGHYGVVLADLGRAYIKGNHSRHNRYANYVTQGSINFAQTDHDLMSLMANTQLTQEHSELEGQ